MPCFAIFHRYGDRREIHDDRYPARGEPPQSRGRYEDRYYEQRGRPESYDRERDRIERDRYGQRIDPRAPPPRDMRDRDPRMEHRGDPRYSESKSKSSKNYMYQLQVIIRH